MTPPGDPGDRFFQSVDPFGQPSEPDGELIYQLQNSQVGDPHIQTLLVERFAADLQRLIKGWLDLEAQPSEAEVLRRLVVDILCAAVQQVTQVRGEASLRNWIYRLAVHRLKKQTGRGTGRKKQEQNNAEGSIAENIFQLATPVRRITWLRYGVGLSLPECADVLHIPEKQAIRLLNNLRAQLSMDIGDEPQSACEILERDLWAYHDSNLAIEKRTQFEAHLVECSDCQQRWGKIQAFSQNLTSEFMRLWPLPVLSKGDLHEINARISDRFQQGPPRLLTNQLGKGAWTLLLIVLFLVAGAIFMRRTTAGPEVLVPTALAEPSTLPDIIPMDLATVQVFGEPYSGGTVQLFAPDQSDDGRWIAYTNLNVRIQDEGTTIHEELFLYDAVTRTSESFFVGPSSQEEITGSYWYTPPSISSDGAWIAFDAISNESGQEGIACITRNGDACLDVFLYAKETGELRLISMGVDGSSANGVSYGPAISADGRWIAFWSDANNLVPEEEPACELGGQPRDCVFIYLYNTESGTLQRIDDSGSQLAEYEIGSARLSLSADGRYVGYSEFIMTSNPEEPVMRGYIYDQVIGFNTPVDVNPAGVPGDGNSSSVILSADGNLVLFASDSTNLVPNDTNGVADVFLLDRLTGTLERISIDAMGDQSDGDSGLIYSGGGYTVLDMSPDGRIITYVSRASNLTRDQSRVSGECNDLMQEDCQSVYIFDRSTYQNERVTLQRNNGWDMFLSISADGQYLSYVDLRTDCVPNLCMDIYQYDRARGWAREVTQSNNQEQGINWTYLGELDPQVMPSNAIAFSTDGNYLFSANNDSRVRVYPVPEQSRLAILQGETESPVVSLAVSPDNRLIAGGTMDGVVNIWDFQELRRVFALDGHPGRVIDVFFSANGEQVIAVTSSEVWVWQFGSEIMTRTARIPVEGPRVTDADLASTGNLLATAREDGTVWLQMLPNGLVLTRLAQHSARVGEVVFSGDGSRLVSEAVDGTIHLWQVDWQGFGALTVTPLRSYQTSNLIGNIEGTEDGAYLAEDGSGLMSEAADGTLILEQEEAQGSGALTSTPVRSYQTNNLIGNIYVSEDGTYLAVGLVPSGIGILNTNNNQMFQVFTAEVNHLAVSAQGDVLAAAYSQGIELWSWPGWNVGMYISQVESDALTDTELSSHFYERELLSADPAGGDNHGMDLYSVDALWPYDLYAPAHLPEEISFQEATIREDGSVLLRYTVMSGNQTSGILTIFEKPVLDEQVPSMYVGQSAVVWDVSVLSAAAEYVRGEWVSTESGGEGSEGTTWTWVNNTDSQRLLWESNGLLMGIYYQETGTRSLDATDGRLMGDVNFSVEPGPHSGQVPALMSMDTLRQIAVGIQAVSQPTFGTYMVPYTVQAGDTCTAIALIFSTTVEAIIGVNQLADNCDVIYAGQILNIPMGMDWEAFNYVDLNCDGRTEMVEINPVEGYDLVSGVRVHAIGDTGLYRLVWSMNRSSVQQSLDQIHLLPTDSCHTVLAVHAWNYGQTAWEVYSWDGTQMQLLPMEYEEIAPLLPGSQ